MDKEQTGAADAADANEEAQPIAAADIPDVTVSEALIYDPDGVGAEPGEQGPEEGEADQAEADAEDQDKDGAESGEEDGFRLGDQPVAADDLRGLLDQLDLHRARQAGFYEDGLRVEIDGQAYEGLDAVAPLMDQGAAFVQMQASLADREAAGLVAGLINREIIERHGPEAGEDAPVLDPEDLDWDDMSQRERALYTALRVSMANEARMRDSSAEALSKLREKESMDSLERIADKEAAVLSRSLGRLITGDDIMEARRATGVQDAERAVLLHTFKSGQSQPEGGKAKQPGGRSAAVVPEGRSQARRADLSGLPIPKAMALMAQGIVDDPNAPPYQGN